MIPPPLIAKAGQLLAPILGKLASPAIKWSLIAALFLASNFWTWHKTTLHCEQQKVQAIAAQMKESEQKQSQITASREEILRQRNDIDRELTQRIINLQKRLVTYERNTKSSDTPIPPDSVGMFNAISGLLAAENNLPASSSSGEPHESSEARIEVTRLLLAYVRAYSDCGGQLAELWQDYDALVRTIRAQYSIQVGDHENH